ncbi:MAG: gfo/Idh/MocA family oxidoreductase [Caldilineae bacterium]|nr:MAG: gfo/Idh/MocA family oxidoreductase [Caldilineae bacterium]
MASVRVGIVGMGIGRPNALAIARHPQGRVVALCDLVEERMEEFARALPEPVRCFTSYEAMCRDPEIDAVFVGTPNQLHAPVALEAIRNGKHVLVTKPLADSEDAARTLVEAAEAAGVVNMMSLSTRFADDVQYLGQLSRTGYFGELYYARARSMRRAGIPNWSPGFIRAGGGAFRDMGVHVLDAAWWLLGMPQPVSVSGVAGAQFGPRGLGYFGRRARGEQDAVTPEYAQQFAADDYAGGFIRFADGTGLQVESFWACHQPGELQIELFGTEAGARLRPVTLYRTQAGAEQDIEVPGVDRSPERRWDAIAAHFIECILDGVPCQAPLRHGLIVQRMMEGLLESAASGQEVRLEG